MDEKTSEKQFYFGTDNFDYVWEKLIDRAFGEKDKEKYFPRSRWLLDYGKYKEKRPLMPDTIMIYNGKYYILDAKCYKYGWTGIPDHLPNGSSINKQITYGEYLEKYKGVDTNSLFNAFIMPYNMAKNYFKLTSFVGNIGEGFFPGCQGKSGERKYFVTMEIFIVHLHLPCLEFRLKSMV